MQKGFGLIGILIVVAIIAGIGAFVFESVFPGKSPFTPSEEEKSAIDIAEQMKDVLEQKNTNTVSSADTTQDETKDWKTYRNEKYGFEFRYPDELIIDERIMPNKAQLLYLWLPTNKGYGFELEVRDPKYTDVENNKPNTSVADIPAYQYLSSDLNDIEMIHTTWLYRDLIYYVSVLGDDYRPISSNTKQVYEKILSTFKFLP